MATVGEVIAGARTKAKLSQKVLAERAGVTRSWLAAVEAGPANQKPGPDKLKKVAAEIGLDIRQLLAMTDQLGAQITHAPDDLGIADLIASQRELIDALRDQNARLQERGVRQEQMVEALVNLAGMELAKGEEMGRLLGEIREFLARGGSPSAPPRASSGSSKQAVPPATGGRK